MEIHEKKKYRIISRNWLFTKKMLKWLLKLHINYRLHIQQKKFKNTKNFNFNSLTHNSSKIKKDF